jgi:hypothetical protein
MSTPTNRIASTKLIYTGIDLAKEDIKADRVTKWNSVADLFDAILK